MSSAIRRLLPVALALTLAWPVPPATAQPPEPGEVGLESLESELRLHTFRFDNFFQAPAGEPEEDVSLSRLEARLAGNLSAKRPWRAYLRARFDDYGSGLDQAWAGGLGLRYEGRHELDLYGEYEQDRPVFEVGDEFDRADVVRLAAEYAFRLSDAWQVGAVGEFRDERFVRTSSKDNEFYVSGATLRYRGWGYDFSPEIGAEWGERDAVDPNEDHDQRDVWIKLRSVPVDGLYLSLRYRYRTRDYTAGDPLDSNFERQDERRQWSLVVDYALTERWSVNGYWAYKDADSTKESRVFVNQLAGVGLVVGF